MPMRMEMKARTREVMKRVLFSFLREALSWSLLMLVLMNQMPRMVGRKEAMRSGSTKELMPKTTRATPMKFSPKG